MSNPYFNYLHSLLREDPLVTVTRVDASDITGTIDSIRQDGCVIASPEGEGVERSTFIAHRDIRGISSIGPTEAR